MAPTPIRFDHPTTGEKGLLVSFRPHLYRLYYLDDSKQLWGKLCVQMEPTLVTGPVMAQQPWEMMEDGDRLWPNDTTLKIPPFEGITEMEKQAVVRKLLPVYRGIWGDHRALHAAGEIEIWRDGDGHPILFFDTVHGAVEADDAVLMRTALVAVAWKEE